MSTSSYEVDSRFVGMAWAMFACVTVLLIPAAVGPFIALHGTQGVPSLVIFVLAWASFSYLILFRAVYRLDLTTTGLRWRTVLRAGEIPLDQLRSVRPGKTTKQILIDVTGRKPLRLPARAGLPEFVATVRQVAPQIQVDVGLVAVPASKFRSGR